MDSIIIFCAKYLIGAVALIVLWVWLRQPKKAKIDLAITVLLAGIAAVILSKIAGKIYFHPRPFVVEHIKPLVAHGNDNGFPSEHTVLAMTLTTVIYFYRRPLAMLAFVLSLVVGIGRVLAHVHSPIDIVAGIAIGVMAGSLGYWLAHKLAAAYTKEPEASAKKPTISKST